MKHLPPPVPVLAEPRGNDRRAETMKRGEARASTDPRNQRCTETLAAGGGSFDGGGVEAETTSSNGANRRSAELVTVERHDWRPGSGGHRCVNARPAVILLSVEWTDSWVYPTKKMPTTTVTSSANLAALTIFRIRNSTRGQGNRNPTARGEYRAQGRTSRVAVAATSRTGGNRASSSTKRSPLLTA
jgi:hypothetical protein